ncbi:hypothetical protein ACH492_37005 [Streptomyces sp. NPDC019443]|uniref:hypothetical protein n=1 Tax=Streptomyces sp. NPDC019443 TaxID=3365061 RepID=UPI0037B7B7CA
MRNRKTIVCTAAILALVGGVPTTSAATTPQAAGRTLVLPAGSVTGVTISAQQTGERWDLTVNYSVGFSFFEKRDGHPYETWVDIWEQDAADDDLVKRGRHVNIGPEPQGRTTTFRMSSDSLDGEEGAEEIYVRAFVKDMETGTQVQQSSRRIQLGV